jgi:hypothetical protein
MLWQRVRHAVGRVWQKTYQFLKPVIDPIRRFAGRLTETKIKLSYFDEVLAIEIFAINERRANTAKRQERPFRPIRKLEPCPPYTIVRRPAPAAAADSADFDTARVDLPPVTRPQSLDLPPPAQRPAMSVKPDRPDPSRVRPQPIPTTAIGLALSGGGIRSAAFSLGALQALDFYGVIARVDYLSTVSGGGYIGACLTAAMSHNNGQFPFGGASDIRDNDAVGYLRNYSNYLMPRARNGLRNLLDASSIILRGLIANAVIVLTFLLAGAFLTWVAYPVWDGLQKSSFAAQLVKALVSYTGVVIKYIGAAIKSLWSAFVPGWIASPLSFAGSWIGSHVSSCFDSYVGPWLSRVADTAPPEIRMLFKLISSIANAIANLATNSFFLTIILAAILAVILIYWVLRRSISAADANDVDSRPLTFARVALGLTVVSLLIDMQPLLIGWFVPLFEKYRFSKIAIISPTALISGAVAVAVFADKLAAFLETTKMSGLRSVRVKRVLTHVLLVVTGLILPLFLVAIYWLLASWLIDGRPHVSKDAAASVRWFASWSLLVLVCIMWRFQANAYSLHQFYKDRLGKAFLFKPLFRSPPNDPEPPELRRYKLSHINTAECPYHIINAALNVQGSTKANQRGRNADFFTFSRHFVGSDLTHFAVTSIHTTTNDMETVDDRLDLGSAMAISGAALSANMGSSTLRGLSPTLALLNIRLGYWLRNPLDLARQRTYIRPRELLYNIVGKFYLFLEMFNLLDENSRFIYLTDGGHIENLGIYQLLKRGCRLIIAIDAEADPEISCSSLLKLERYARIDLGIRIVLPWEQIRERNRKVNELIDPSTPDEPSRQHGPHCALGRIFYEDGSQGILLYFKASLSGDEKDYLLNYKKRNSDFPHETTGDQFFTEEQFEVYRTLGYHVVDGHFSNLDDVAWLRLGNGAWLSLDDAKKEILSALESD